MNTQSGTEISPLQGTMAGVKLSFPRTESGGATYSVASVHYSDDKGTDWWGSKPNKEYSHPTQDSIIRDFMITVNRETFRPISSKADLYSYTGNYRAYGDANLPPESTRWLEFIFSPQIYVEGNGQLKRLYEQQVAASNGLIGPFIPRPDAFGLRQVSSDREGGPERKAAARDVYDTWYFDDESWHTLIACMRESGNSTPNKLTCVHYFVVPEIKAVAYGRYMVMADVSDWKRIETEVRKLALSFVVADPAR
jgi:hypothetical protein